MSTRLSYLLTAGQVVLVLTATFSRNATAHCDASRYRNAIKVIGVKPNFEYANWLVYERPTAVNVTFLQLHNERHLRHLCKNSLPRHLMELVLNDVGIEYLEDGVFNNGNYISVILSDNRLTRIEKNVFSGTNIVSLILSGNEINFIEDGAFNNMVLLEAIDLNYNKLRRFNGDWFINCPKLYDVSITHNFIKTVPENATKHILGTLTLNSTALYRNLPGLNMDHNEIDFIHPKAFRYGPNKFHLISFNNNLLEEVPENVFGTITFLFRLFLNSNNFTCIPNETIVRSLVNVRMLYMGGNPLQQDPHVRLILH